MNSPAAKRQKLDHRSCEVCNIQLSSSNYQGHLRSRAHRDNIATPLEDGVVEIASAFKGRITTYKITPMQNFLNIDDFFEDISGKFIRLIQQQLAQLTALKINVELFGLYIIESKEMLDVKSFNTPNTVITLGTDLQEIITNMKGLLYQRMSEFAERDSGWALVHLLFLELNINHYNPLRASSFIDLPICIKRKNAIVNIKNKDEACFAWSVIAAVCQPKGLDCLTSSYPHYSKIFNFDSISFPVKLDKIQKFEQQNNVSVNVYGLELIYENDTSRYEIVGPLYYTKCKKVVHINLLLIGDDEGNKHYCLIKDLSRLVSSQISKHNGRKHFCDACLQYFQSNEALQRHNEYDCGLLYSRVPNSNPIINRYGKTVPGNLLQFENFPKQLRVPFVIYADFECLLKPIATSLPNPAQSFNVKTFKHEPYSCGYYMKCTFDDRLSKFQLFRGDNCTEQFLANLEQDVRYVYDNYLSVVKKMLPLSDRQQFEHTMATSCYICNKPFTSSDIKVREHCHLIGLYQGASHSGCNLQYKLPNFIPVVFHNLTNYDVHLFIKKLALNEESVDVVAQSKEKYVTFSKSIHVGEYINSKGQKVQKYFKIRFIDSFRFLAAPLAKLAESLSDGQYVELTRLFNDDPSLHLLQEKGVLPYSYLDNLSKLDDRELPSQDDFYDKLKDEHISTKEYERAKQIWTAFGCETLGDYSDLYLKTDILLLADIFENFRNVCLENYGLDPAQYVTVPSLSWDAMLKHSKVQLELLTDIDMLHFFKNGIRGGVSTVIKRYSIANNKLLPNYNPLDPSSFILYVDATNLYGYSMRQYLPTDGFTWLRQDEITALDIMSLSDTSSEGYVLEVDLEYPRHLHNAHNDMPFCPENIIPPDGKFPKLIPNLCDKKNYIIHYRNLKQCLKHGLTLTKIHRVLKFQQSPWLQTYIDLNTQLRGNAKSKFEKDLFKLMNNSVFGKTMENVENRVDIKLLTHWKKRGHKWGAETYIARPNFKNSHIFCENLIAVEMSKVQVTYNKPVYVGFCILDLAKTVMYEFYYDFLKPKYGTNCSLLYTDTDSLILEIYTENVYEDIKNNLDKFDTSNYSAHNCHNIPPNTSRLGAFKDEYGGLPIKSFYGISAKAYCVELLDSITKKAKGVSKHVVETKLALSDYKDVIMNNSVVVCSMSIFKSCLHDMFTELRNKVALSSLDDKRFLLKNSPNTLAWGHCDIETHKNLDFLLEHLG